MLRFAGLSSNDCTRSRVEPALDNTSTSEGGRVPIKRYLYKQEKEQIWPEAVVADPYSTWQVT